MNKIIKKIIGISVFLFIAICFINIVVQRIKGQIPSLFNHSIFIILTDSMTPDYKVKDVILVNKNKEVKKDDVITYIGNSGDYAGKTITHKVIEEPIVIDGVKYYQTQGIKQGATLDPKITEEQIVGVVVCKLPIIGFIYRTVTTLWGFILVIVVPLSSMFVFQVIDMSKKVKEEEAENEQSKK